MMRILVATGGATHSDVAIRLGGNLARFLGAELALLTVVLDDEGLPAARERLVRGLEFLPADLRAEVATEVRIGEVAREIVSAAREGNYNLIVVGERPRHTLWSRLLSPISERVIARAHCPVLIAKSVSDKFQQILICESGMEGRPLLERLTATLPSLITDETDVTVLHVMSQISAAPGVRGWQLRADAEALIAAQTPEGELLEHDLSLLEETEAHPHAKIRHGRVVEEILDEAACADYDLIVIGAHRTEGWQKLLLDDIAHQLIGRIKKPLLVVQAQ
ncbi:MAG: universal stress protein [Candidatus Promineifilaceae bacterium]|nr:universal stress protein [Candidatus Promineifilaceae bacterium]